MFFEDQFFCFLYFRSLHKVSLLNRVPCVSYVPAMFSCPHTHVPKCLIFQLGLSARQGMQFFKLACQRAKRHAIFFNSACQKVCQFFNYFSKELYFFIYIIYLYQIYFVYFVYFKYVPNIYFLQEYIFYLNLHAVCKKPI